MSISPAHHDRLVAQGRDEMMTAFLKALPAAPNEAQQRAASERFAGFMQTIIPEIVGVVATGDYPAYAVKLENIDGKGKIALKAIDVDKAGPALITKLGSSLTLVLTDADQFDVERPAASIIPDQRPLPLEVAEPEDEAFAEEMAEIAEEASSRAVDPPVAGPTDLEPASGPLFTAIEDEPCTLPGGETIRPWTIVHGTMEVFVPIAAEAFVAGAADKLNAFAAELERDPTPAEVRNCILGVLNASQEEIGIAFHPPYSAEVEQDNAAPAAETAKPKRGPKTGAEKVAAYFAGFDGAASDLMTEDCPHDRGSLREEWIAGLQDAKAGKPARWERPNPTPRQMGRAAFARGANSLDGHPEGMSFPDIGEWRAGWAEAQAEAQAEQQPAANDDGAEPRESTGNVAA